jgi:hypothetical protein
MDSLFRVYTIAEKKGVVYYYNVFWIRKITALSPSHYLDEFCQQVRSAVYVFQSNFVLEVLHILARYVPRCSSSQR